MAVFTIAFLAASAAAGAALNFETTRRNNAILARQSRNAIEAQEANDAITNQNTAESQRRLANAFSKFQGRALASSASRTANQGQSTINTIVSAFAQASFDERTLERNRATERINSQTRLDAALLGFESQERSSFLSAVQGGLNGAQIAASFISLGKDLEFLDQREADLSSNNTGGTG